MKYYRNNLVIILLLGCSGIQLNRDNDFDDDISSSISSMASMMKNETPAPIKDDEIVVQTLSE